MRVEGIPYVPERPEREPDRRAVLADARLHLRDLLGSAAVLAGEVGDQLRPLGAHVGVELEGLDADGGLHGIAQGA